MGNAIKDFAGYNYKDATLDKLLRELKYLGIADSLLRHQSLFGKCNSARPGSISRANRARSSAII